MDTPEEKGQHPIFERISLLFILLFFVALFVNFVFL